MPRINSRLRVHKEFVKATHEGIEIRTVSRTLTATAGTTNGLTKVQQTQSASPGLAKYWRLALVCAGAAASSSNANRAAATINLRSCGGIRSQDEVAAS